MSDTTERLTLTNPLAGLLLPALSALSDLFMTTPSLGQAWRLVGVQTIFLDKLSCDILFDTSEENPLLPLKLNFSFCLHCFYL